MNPFVYFVVVAVVVLLGACKDEPSTAPSAAAPTAPTADVPATPPAEVSGESSTDAPTTPPADTPAEPSSDAGAGLPAPVLQTLLAAAGEPHLPPILLPDNPELLATAKVVVGSTWVAVSMRGPDYYLYVHASSGGHDFPGVALPAGSPPSQANPRISRVHEIVSADFVAGTNAWDVEIECLGGIAHPLCSDDSLINALVGSLQPLEAP